MVGAAALSGATIVGINPTRRGEGLARDITHTECQLIVTESRHCELLDGLDLGAADGASSSSTNRRTTTLLAPYARRAAARRRRSTTRTSSCCCSRRAPPARPRRWSARTAGSTASSRALSRLAELDRRRRDYWRCRCSTPTRCSPAWAPTLAAGATFALRRRFSASGFLPDVRKFGATYFNYVGKPLAYILATPEQPDDADNPLRRGFGNEGAERRRAPVRRRASAARSSTGTAQTETGASIARVPGMPRGLAGQAGTDDVAGHRSRDRRGVPAGALRRRRQAAQRRRGDRRDRQHRAAAASRGTGRTTRRTRSGCATAAYWTGDLGVPRRGRLLLLRRSQRRLDPGRRRELRRRARRAHPRALPACVLAAVYGVPDPERRRPGDGRRSSSCPAPTFDPDAFVAFLAEQRDLGTKWAPTYVRIVDSLPDDRDQQDPQARAGAERWEVDIADLVAPRPRGASCRSPPPTPTRCASSSTRRSRPCPRVGERETIVSYSVILMDDPAPMVRRITLNRPEKRNPLDAHDAPRDPHTRSASRPRPRRARHRHPGAGKCFSAGYHALALARLPILRRVRRSLLRG